MADEMEWLRNHMQSYMADWTSSDPSEKVVRLRISRGSTSEHTQRALSLISDAAQLISDMEERAKLYKRTATHCSLTQSKS